MLLKYNMEKLNNAWKCLFQANFQVKLNLMENFEIKNQWQKDKGWSLWKVILKKALKFETAARFIKNKKMDAQYIAFGLKMFIIHVCIPMQKYLLIWNFTFFTTCLLWIFSKSKIFCVAKPGITRNCSLWKTSTSRKSY